MEKETVVIYANEVSGVFTDDFLDQFDMFDVEISRETLFNFFQDECLEYFRNEDDDKNGISDEVKNNCDELIIIPWGNYENGQKESLVDSLNVAQAASIIFYEFVCCPERF